MDDEVKEKKTAGEFGTALKRSNKQIKDSRADSIIRKAQTKYKRTVEDLIETKTEMEAEREEMLDMSPTNSMNLVVASDFDPEDFIKKDLEIGVKLRNLDIKIDIAKERYKYLFGEEL